MLYMEQGHPGQHLGAAPSLLLIPGLFYSLLQLEI